jgi:predicted nucleotidyltransferase
MWIELLTKRPLIELWATEVGSGMWGMESLASDHDLVVIYASPIFDVLTGDVVNTLPQKMDLKMGPSRFNDDKPIDISAMEIGHLVHLLSKGNINAIWSVISPNLVSVTHQFHKCHSELKHLVCNGLSKKTYHSVRGMALSQVADADKRADVRATKKSLMTALRTINFGINLLGDHIDFIPVSDNISTNALRAKVRIGIEDLDRAMEQSHLPEQPPEDQFRRHLFKLRVAVASYEHEHTALAFTRGRQ